MAIATAPSTEIAIPQEFSATEQQGLVLVGEAELLVITTDSDAQHAAGMRVAAKAFIENIKEITGPSVKAGLAAHRAALAVQGKLLGNAEMAVRLLDKALSGYQDRREAARRLVEAEAERIRQEAQRGAEKAAREAEAVEQKRLEAERAAKAMAATRAGDPAAAERILDQPVEVTRVPVAIVLAPPVQTSAPLVLEGVSFRGGFDFEVTDDSLVPREYLSVDHKKIGAVVRALKEQARIPGVRVFPKTGVAGRA